MADSPLRSDFSAISESFETLATEFTRVANLPVVDSSQRVLEAMERVMTKLDDIQRELRQGFARVESALEVLRRENTARDRNRLIALENGVVDAQGSLKPLYSLSSEEVIANFPQRINEVTSLSCDGGGDEDFDGVEARCGWRCATEKTKTVDSKRCDTDCCVVDRIFDSYCHQSVLSSDECLTTYARQLVRSICMMPTIAVVGLVDVVVPNFRVCPTMAAD
ncbi:hypothetical protein MY3296_004709 [Beauveria thailandica]